MSESTKKRLIGRHACEPCRKSKIRCLTDTLDEHSKCRRCYASGLECNWRPISKTRTRQRTNARVAELERQVCAMSANLRSSDALPSTLSRAESQTKGTTSELPEHSASSSLNMNISPGRNSSDQIYRSSLEQHGIRTSTIVYNEVLNTSDHPTSNFTNARKEELFSIFITKLLPQCPFVGVPSGANFADIEKSRPFTVAAMITAACSFAEPELFKPLYQANIRLLANQAVILGNKSLDLVQAFLISATWTDPPDDLSRMNIFQWTHIASTMANELDLVERLYRQAHNQHITQPDPANSSEQGLELLRVTLGVYLTCSRISISCHKQNLAVFHPWMAPLLDKFSCHTAGINDRRLAKWIQLQLIAEDIETLKREIRTHLLKTDNMKKDLALFHERLRNWEKGASQTTLTDTMKMDLWFYWSKLHCFSIYFDEDTRHLELSSLATNGGGSSPTTHVSLNPTSVRGLFSCVKNCHSILDVFLGLDYESVRCMSTLALLRVPYAFKAMSTLEKRASDPNDSISRIIDQETVQWPYYAKIVSQAMEGASQGGLYPAPTFVLRIRNRAVNTARLRDVANRLASEERIAPLNSIPPSTSGASIDPSSQIQPDFLLDAFVPGWMDLDFPIEFAFDEHWDSETHAGSSHDIPNFQNALAP